VHKQLRILGIVNLPWDPRLGAARVWFELCEQWTKAGHQIDRFCLTDAFPNPTRSRALSVWRQAVFPYRAARYVRRNAGQFDLIDCLIGTLPFSKKSLRFRGLVVGRSIGLYLAYDEFIRFSRRRWPDQPRGKFVGRLFTLLRHGCFGAARIARSLIAICLTFRTRTKSNRSKNILRRRQLFCRMV
jgi:hypothetical protein